MIRLTLSLAALAAAIMAQAAPTSHYGVNYTTPFAHAYRAVNASGHTPQQAIDVDTYHMARLGFNALRLHMWDTELTDSIGNLIDNEHLDALDYMIAKLEQRGIDIILTPQTNFGNGYPERNSDKYGSYSYRYDKCQVHDHPDAQAAQERYLSQLMHHVNPYTGKTYAADNSIIGLEINNEPCHSGTVAQITAYVNRMVKALRNNGWKKDILYNVSHNLDRTQAFYDSKIDGTTYQWYPLGLVSGHMRQGNFLPYVDNYNIPFTGLKGYDKKWRAVYEYDPADNLYSYLYPAATRTFRKDGFRWITQFAYDPLYIAPYNTEYQTHYLNLAYTPRKALGMLIAAEVAKQVPEGADYGKYPADTVFGAFTVSAKRDLAMCNDGEHYYYTNNTDVAPVDAERLRAVAGWGTSPVVSYDGTGAYFIDKVSDNVWRVELMPDVLLTSDPFAKPSPSRRVGVITYAHHPMDIRLPGIGSDACVRQIRGIPGYDSAGRQYGPLTSGQSIAYPGVYLIGDKDAVEAVDITAPFGTGAMRIDEYVLPDADALTYPIVVNHPAQMAYKALGVDITAEIAGAADSVFVIPAYVSIWRDNNPVYRMVREGSSPKYSVNVPQIKRGMPYDRTHHQRPETPRGEYFGDTFDYFITVYADGKAVTYPGAVEGSPLDWSFVSDRRYTTRMLDYGQPVPLIEAEADMDGTQLAVKPVDWTGVSYRYRHSEPMGRNAYVLNAPARSNPSRLYISKYVGDLPLSDDEHTALSVDIAECQGADSLLISVVNADGFTYTATVPATAGVKTVGLSEMRLAPTVFLTESFPAFAGDEFVPDPATATPLSISEAERIIITVQPTADVPVTLSLTGVWADAAAQ